MDAMSYEGWHSLRPAFIEVTLQGKVSRDEESNKMLNLIFDSTFYDTGILFQFGNMVSTVRNIYGGLSGEFVSAFQKTEKLMNKTIESLIKTVESFE